MRKSVLLSASLLAMVALAALPISASASPVLKNWKSGVALKKGDKVLGDFLTHVFALGASGVTCHTILEGEVIENTGTKIAIEFKNISTTGSYGTTGKMCPTGLTGPDGKFMHAALGPDDSPPWCLEATAARAHEAWLTGGACGGKTHPVRFTLDFYEQSEPHNLVASCTYGAETEEGKGTYTTKSSPLTVEIPTWNFAREAGNPTWCPAKGNLYGKMQVTSNDGKLELTVIE